MDCAFNHSRYGAPCHAVVFRVVPREGPMRGASTHSCALHAADRPSIPCMQSIRNPATHNIDSLTARRRELRLIEARILKR